MDRCFVFAAGTFYGLRQRPLPGDLVIAADAGYHICRAEGIQPDLLLGDFDSMDAPADVSHLCRLPVEKDDTDTLAALRYGLAQDCREFHIYGGTGGRRLDHTLANLQSLLFLRRQGAQGFLYDDDFLWTVIENESLSLTREADWGLVSIFCLGDRADGVSLRGLQYPLEDAVLTSDFPLGVSNHFAQSSASVAVRRGALAVGWQTASLFSK